MELPDLLPHWCTSVVGVIGDVLYRAEAGKWELRHRSGLRTLDSGEAPNAQAAVEIARNKARYNAGLIFRAE